MDRLLRLCLAMTLAIVALALMLVAAGVPGVSIVALTPLLLCLGMHLVMGHHAGAGRTSVRHDRGVGAKERMR